MTDQGNAAAALQPLSPYEIATGFPLGLPGARRADGGGRAVQSPLGEMEEVILATLQRPPCVVHFSGGRDSSAILAVAADVARRHGLSLPIPLTIRFPGACEAQEDEWQQLVVRHLGLPDWARVDPGEDADLLGPAAQDVLARHGVIWSPVLSTRVPFMRLAAGGSLLSGEGGDEVLGPRRPTSIAGLAHPFRPHASASRATVSLYDVAPRRVRAQLLRRRLAERLRLDWLRPEVRNDFLDRCAAQWAAEPFIWGRAIDWVTSCRHVRLGATNMAALAGEVGASLEVPFLHQHFVRALAGAFGPLGPLDRTAAMRSLFGHLLPDELLSRHTKAVFTLPAWGPRTKEFVASWTGDGLRRDLVDVDVLRRHWNGPRPSAMSFGLLQAAWLARQAG